MWRSAADRAREQMGLKPISRSPSSLEQQQAYNVRMLPSSGSEAPESASDRSKHLAGSNAPANRDSSSTDPPSTDSSSSDPRPTSLLPSRSDRTQAVNQISPVQDAFRRTLYQSWRPVSAYPSRGVLFFRGQVECAGSLGSVMIGVKAAYNPKTSKFENVDLNVRSTKPFKQQPLV